jgi:hypothetical protein
MDNDEALRLYLNQQIDSIELRQNLSPDAWQAFLDGAYLATRHALEGYPPNFDPKEALSSPGFVGYTLGHLDSDQDVSPGI